MPASSAPNRAWQAYAYPDRQNRLVRADRVGIEGLSLHSYTWECQPGLVVGYGYLAEPSIERRVRLLAEALGNIRDGPGWFGLPRRAKACAAPEPLRNSG
jgi:hypothetical protein